MSDQKALFNDFVLRWKSGEDIEAHTSGSTGKPKDIVLPLSQIRRSARRTNGFFGINRHSHLHSCVSFEFIGGKMMIARSLEACCTLSFDSPSLCPTPPVNNGSRTTLMAVVPAQMDHILRNIGLFSNVDNFLIGGSSIDHRLWARIVSSDISAWESYGMTETASHIALRKIEGDADARPPFRAFDDVVLETDDEGCLVIRDGDILVHTNDLADILPDGSFFIKGRRDDVIISGGIKVIPQDLERRLLPFIIHLARDFYVTSVPDMLWTSRLVLVCVPVADCDASSLRIELERILRNIPEGVVSKKIIPKEVVLADSLPMTSSGKLNRRHRI